MLSQGLGACGGRASKNSIIGVRGLPSPVFTETPASVILTCHPEGIDKPRVRGLGRQEAGGGVDDHAFQQAQLQLQKQAHKNSTRNMWIAALGLILVLFTNAFTLWWSVTSFQQQAQESDQQFTRSLRGSDYRNIVDGLSSQSAAVQTSSMLALVQYVQDPNNFDLDRNKQIRQARNAIQTLTAFIEDYSSPTSLGLPNYESPQPIVISRAMQRLRTLVESPELGPNSFDISRANLHGLYMPHFVPVGTLEGVAVDFRRADLSGMDLSGMRSANFGWAFLTCANLKGAKFGRANLEGADLSGADLSGADLSKITNLEAAQMVGATVDKKTRMPSSLGPRNGWGQTSRRCIETVDHMTGMLPGQGFIRRLPCPVEGSPESIAGILPQFKGRAQDLIAVCKARAGS